MQISGFLLNHFFFWFTSNIYKGMWFVITKRWYTILNGMRRLRVTTDVWIWQACCFYFVCQLIYFIVLQSLANLLPMQNQSESLEDVAKDMSGTLRLTKHQRLRQTLWVLHIAMTIICIYVRQCTLQCTICSFVYHEHLTLICQDNALHYAEYM